MNPIFLLSLLFCYVGADNKGYFWHVTDFHYDHTYWTSGLSCNADVARPGRLGDYWCDSPWALITHATSAMAAIRPDVDFLLWTGDTVAHIKDEDLSEDLNMEVLANLTSALTSAFPSTPVYATYGNHDYFPANQLPGHNSRIYNVTADMWRHWIVDEAQLDNFRKGGYYSVVTRHGLRVACLNTNLYYTSDKVTPGIEDPADQLAWLRNLLQDARDNGQKVLVTAHIPPGIHTPSTVSWFHEEFRRPVLDVLQSFSDVIVGLHFGHDHADGFKVLYDAQGEPGAPLFVAPSVTPWRYKLSNGAIGPPHNPSLRLVTYDRDTGRHLDLQQYNLDLPTAALSGQPYANFTLLYTFTEQYGVPDLTASSLQRLFSRMGTATEGDRLLQDYYRLINADAEQEEGAKECDRECRGRILCGFRHYAMDDFEACLLPYTDSAPSLSHTPAAILILLSILTLIIGL